METLMITFVLGLLGLISGSFAGAQVWRLRARQLKEDDSNGEKHDKKELHKLEVLLGTKVKDDRSRCLSCGHVLSSVDLIPLVSWLSTGGRCRYCHKRIGAFEPLIELGAAVVFVTLFLTWPGQFLSPLEIIKFILWLLASVALIMLFAYDLKWFLLPNMLVAVVVGAGILISGITILEAQQPLAALVGVLGGISILSGIYAILWAVSKGMWIGFGDVKLGLGLGLLLADWRLCFIALFAANAIGCLIVIPQLLTGKVSRTTRVPFGPLLITGTYIALWFGGSIIHWFTYLTV